MQGRAVDIDIKRVEYADGAILALRTPFGWFPTTLRRDGESLVVSFEESELPPSDVDLRIVQAARLLLADEAAWDRRDDRICESTDTTFSLYCAMHRATIDVTDEFHHRQPALQAVRAVVQSMWSARYSDHRLMDFNNHPDTTLTDIQATLAEAESRIDGDRSRAQSDLGPVLATLEGRWEGEGELLDRPAAFGMTWDRSLNGRYPAPRIRQRVHRCRPGRARAGISRLLPARRQQPQRALDGLSGGNACRSRPRSSAPPWLSTWSGEGERPHGVHGGRREHGRSHRLCAGRRTVLPRSQRLGIGASGNPAARRRRSGCPSASLPRDRVLVDHCAWHSMPIKTALEAATGLVKPAVCRLSTRDTTRAIFTYTPGEVIFLPEEHHDSRTLYRAAG